jgi:DNA-binding CsgD family transcriptional regulator
MKKRKKRKGYSDKELLEHYKTLADKLGRVPRERDLKESEFPYYVYHKQFGSLKKVWKILKIKPGMLKYKTKYTDEYLLSKIEELTQKLGRLPVITDIKKASFKGYGVCILRFGKMLTEQKKKNMPLFSEKELQVISLICEELTNAEIGQKLKVEKRTIEQRRENILQKTKSKNSIGIVKYAIRHKLYKLR